MTDTDDPIPSMIKNVLNVQLHQQHSTPLTQSTTMVMGAGELFRHVNPNGFMWLDDGDREMSVFIPFSQPFRRAPNVQLNLVGIDASHAQNLRLKLRVAEASTDGFVAVAQTWQDTRIASVDVSWVAIGQVAARLPESFSATTRKEPRP